MPAVSPPTGSGAPGAGASCSGPVGLGAFFVGPSLIALYDDVGRWTTIAALVAAASAALFFFIRPARGRGLPRAAVDKRASRA